MSFGGSSSGSSSIHAGTDVALSNPADGQMLGYSASLQKWQNQEVILDSTQMANLDSRYVASSVEGNAGGIATLDSSGLVPTSQLPLSTQAITITGNGAPSSSVGLNGDYYLDYASGRVYLKTSGSWGLAGTVPGNSSVNATVVSKTAAYTANSGEVVFANGSFSVTSPAVASGAQVTIKNSGTGSITFAPASGTVDGAASYVLSTQYAAKRFICDGTNWGVFYA